MSEQETIVRAVTIPVSTAVGMEWGEFLKLCYAGWRQTTQAHNVAMSTLVSLDFDARSARAANTGKGKPKPKAAPGESPANLVYHQVRQVVPDLPTMVVAGISNRCAAKYKQERWQMLTGQRSLPTFRFPTPYPLKAGEAWRNLRAENGEHFVDVRMPGGQWATVRLKRGRDWWRQLASVDRIIDGTYKGCEFAIIGQLRDGKVRNVLLKLVFKMPKPTAERGSSGDLLVSTCPTSFLVCRVKGDRRNERYSHHDNLPRLIAAHDHRMARLRDDCKAERRNSGSAHGPLAAMDRITGKNDARMKTFRQQRAAELVGIARRRRVSRVVVDLRDYGFAPHFAWFVFREQLKSKCEEHGIGFATMEEIREASKDKKAAAALVGELAELDRVIQEALAQEQHNGRTDGDDGGTGEDGRGGTGGGNGDGNSADASGVPAAPPASEV